MTDWKRTYWVVWAANLITSIGMMSFLPFFPSLLEELGVEGEGNVAAWSGACFAAAPLSATFSSPIWGAVGDRFGRKLMVCRSMLAIALFVGSMAFVTAPWQLLALRSLQGMFSGFIPPSITLVSILAPANRQGRIAGNLTTALAIGGLAGPLIGGLAVTLLGSHQRVFYLVAVLATLATLMVWFGAYEDPSMRRTGDRPKGVRNVLKTSFSDLREVAASPIMRSMALLVFAMQFGLGALNPVLDLYVRDVLEGVDLQASWLASKLAALSSEGDLSLLERVEALATSFSFGAMAIASLIALNLWGRWGDRIGHRRALVQCSLVCVVSLIIQASSPVLWVLLLGRFVMGVGMAGIGPLAFGLAAGEASADRRGGAFGAVFSARTFAVAVGGISGGFLYRHLGAQGLMVLAAVVVLGALALFVLRSKGEDLSA